MSARSNRGRRRLIVTAAVAALATGVSAAPAALAHGPDPLLGTGTRWDRDQVVGYQWHAGGVPPAWAAAEIDDAAEDIEQSRGSRAALFQRVSSADSKIYYGLVVPCSSYGIACMNRTGVPDSFAGMWFRPHGWQFDWGTLKWCQALATYVNGCYDVENVALDEFGHVELLGHHVNYSDESDFTDSVVQFAARSRPKEGWNQHVLGRCDVARLQLEYGLTNSGNPVSSCLDLSTALTIAGPTSVTSGTLARIVGTLEVAVATGARELSGDPLSLRVVTLQKRPLGGSWSTVNALAPTGVAGSYGLTFTVNQTADYRLQYDAPSTEGLRNSVSATIRITATTSTCATLQTTESTSKKGAVYLVPPPC